MLDDLNAAFTRGLRWGMVVAVTVLGLSLSLGVGLVFTESRPTSTAPAQTSDLALMSPAQAPPKKSAEPVHQPDEAMFFALSMDDLPATPDIPLSDEELAILAPPPVAPPSPTPTAAPTVAAPRHTPAPPLPGSGLLYEIIAEYFPEQPEKAYAVAMCESAGNPWVNSGNGYFGLWQFDLPTWQSVGGSGLPSDASIREQVTRARALYDARGWSPWGCA